MNQNRLTRISKRLSLILRHKPESIGLNLDAQGWAKVSELLDCLKNSGQILDRKVIEEVVRTNEKQRFRFSEDRTQICANQGHSIRIEFTLKPSKPPAVLFHGTAARFLKPIYEEGLQKQQRHHVHMTEDTAMTMKVAARRGKPVLLGIRATEMHEAGYEFYKTENNVWLTDHVPVNFLYEA